MQKEAQVKTQKKLTATQRIDALEGLVGNLSVQIQTLADEINKDRNTIRALGQRLNATIEAGSKGAIDNDTINDIVVDGYVKEMEEKVAWLKEKQAMEDDPEGMVTDQHFIVGRELDSEGKVTNKRLQFAVGSVDPSLQIKVIDMKVGDKKENEDGSFFELTDLYKITIQEQKQEYEEEAEVEVDEELAQEAPEEAGSETGQE